ncbi:MAG: pilus assembly protein TadG-related protein [Geminicoccaceae bacterium]
MNEITGGALVPTHLIKDSGHRNEGLGRNESGTIIAPLAIMMPILIGMAGIGVDIGSWYHGKRQAQAAADAAARAGALELVRNGSESVILLAAKEDAEAHGFSGTEIDINMPPQAGAYAGDGYAVEAVIQHRPKSYFAQALLDLDVTVEARAVAKAFELDTCVWALEETDTGITINGTADVVLDCGIFVNSTNSIALDQVGSSCVTASSIRVVGGHAGTCLDPEPVTAYPYPDPLADLGAPSVGSCDHNGKVKINGGNVTLEPGVYCKGIDVAGGAHVTFNAGEYVFKGGRIKVTGGSSLEGDEVIFYLTDGSGGHAELDITATTIDLSAPTAGEFEGILFFQDRMAPTTKTNKISGNASVELDGALYFPTTMLDFAGTSSSTIPSPMIVAREIRFTGTTSLGGNGAEPPIMMVEADLVE